MLARPLLTKQRALADKAAAPAAAAAAMATPASSSAPSSSSAPTPASLPAASSSSAAAGHAGHAGHAVFAATASTASLGGLASSSGAYSFEALQRARSQSSGALLGNLRKPLSLTFRDLDVWVTKPSRQWFAGMRGIPPVQQQVLNRVNGGAQAGEMLAIMGPSGKRVKSAKMPHDGKRRRARVGRKIANVDGKGTGKRAERGGPLGSTPGE